MSFVSVIATENFITVMSDGLVVNTETGEEIEQRYKKFNKIGDNQFIAFGGNKGLGEEVVKTIGYHSGERDLFSFVNPIRNQLIKEIPPHLASCQLVLGGIENGAIVFYSFNNDPSQDVIIQKPKGTDGQYSFLGSHEHGLNLDNELQKLYSVIGFKTPIRT